MRIIINTTDVEPIQKQLEAAKQYIERHKFQETPKGIGRQILHDQGKNHVSCKKTGTGYSFKVWRAV